ncbi:GTPase HflX [Virgibacillus halodenitrificans]|uniref:GTPase HflX n=1 Tax=Virgibacillus halodenitrificans TaxID=1482 RepID=A0AAC9IZ70_VIRHA|nr:GTPase HflX [Virgibacillus halodenitrificans]APC48546.1 GTPase HflX [Virgibacillus halodenitrificans]MBD1224295.1 GTPase HflX [Virgibacillus halodenitrificans]MCG1028420.1 GTPase HflX [Virgibacillus halodenitrificans]MCJ0931122.1 GTPase HflX [Virgibacillus halodenitrificans]MEC2160930.1 GTPase HflX [Virgibacillus halodenitrificans]
MTVEKILVIAVMRPRQNEERFQSSLEELISLSQTAGGAVQKIMVQKRDRIHPANYIGTGKMEEIKQEIEELDIELVISNDELSSGQLRNLGNEFGVRIIDRSQLILDIFAQRARTKEGKLQVELAQLEYMLPRLRGQGASMSRLGAGIGTRGPGETKLETDQRHIRRRIYDIKRRLSSVAQQREQYRKRRKANEVFQIAVVGYTNAGKSTLFNRLTDSESMVEDKLFATLDPLTRQIKLPSGFQSLLTDTVGFIQDLPTSLIAAFKSTLEEVSEADFLLHVVDGSNPDLEQHQHTVRILLEELHADTIPMLTIYNKKDLMEKDFIPSNHPYFIMSAYEDGDVDLLQTKIEESLIKEWKYYKLELRPDEGKIMTRLELETIVKDKYFNEEKNYYIVKGYMQKNHALESLLEE